MHRPPRSQLARPLTVAAALAALTPAAGPPAAASPGSVPHGLDLAGIDRAAAPGEDFFRYANGNWLKATEIPPDRSSYGTSAMLAELTTQRTVDLIRAAADGAAAGSEAAKIGDYYAHIAAVLTLAHLPDAAGAAARIFELERRMAQVHSSRAESEEVLKGNNHWARQDFAQRAPGLDWQAFLGAAGLKAQNRFVVWQPGAVIGLSALTMSVPLETWKEYLRFHALEHASAYLPKAFVQEHFAFHEQTLSGTPQLRPRWRGAVDETNAARGEAVGKLYVQRYFR